MRVTVLDVRKKRNNAASVLASGLCEGTLGLGMSCEVVRYTREWPDGRREVDPDLISSDTDALLIPYWISNKIWDINVAAIRKRLPNIKIICYTGTSPYWNGSTPRYVPETRGIDTSGLLEEQRSNFDAIDLFGVVRSRHDVNYLMQRVVGMGMLPEIVVGQKAKHPMIVLDNMKPGWDEDTYIKGVEFVSRAMESIKDLRVVILGANQYNMKLVALGARVLAGDFLPFEDVAKLWSVSWAFICHNESFGYPIVENNASGTKVFCTPIADIPHWHSGYVSRIEEMHDHLIRWSSMSSDQRQIEASSTMAAYREAHPDLFCWKSTVEKLLA